MSHTTESFRCLELDEEWRRGFGAEVLRTNFHALFPVWKEQAIPEVGAVCRSLPRLPHIGNGILMSAFEDGNLRSVKKGDDAKQAFICRMAQCSILSAALQRKMLSQGE